MKKINSLLALIFLASASFAQVKIHSHNDYEQKLPLITAYNNSVYQIEADIWEVNGVLLVAHSKKDLNPLKTLNRLYLNPIDSLFKHYKGKVSANSKYGFVLMIDFKTAWQPTYLALEKQLVNYGEIFDRSSNAHAIQIVISGNRPPDSTFHSYPKWVFFDGLPRVNYTKKDLKRVTMISDNFKTYSKWNGIGSIPEAEKKKLQAVIDAAHRLKKPVRFWNAPDTEDSWRELTKLGADIINTDKIIESKRYFESHKNGF